MFYEDTIAAIATSSKDGSISIIRISGPEAVNIVSNSFVGKSGKKIDLTQKQSHTIHFGYIKDSNGEVIDEVIVLLMKAPKSYTMEDVVEVQCHGGSFVCQILLEHFVKEGVRIAQPGEFTKRAFLNGRIDLSQAESVMDIIQSDSELALHNSLNQLRGDIKVEVEKMREVLLTDIAFVEAALDDPEHLSLDGYVDTILDHARQLLEQVEHLLKNSENGKIIKEGIQTVIVGKPNVGKSSFLNCILREDRAIVTDIAGTTRDTLEEEVRIGTTRLHLIDTAGIRKTEDTVEKIGVEKSLKIIDTSDLLIYILNNNEEITEEEKEILEKTKNKKRIIVVNKIDLKTKLNKKLLDSYIEISVKENIGIDKIKDEIKRLFNIGEISTNDMTYLSNARSIALLKKSLNNINDAINEINNNNPIDIVELSLKESWNNLGEVIGETYTDELLDELFSRFCLGK
mgnify:CR=1 FL=1